MKMRKNFRKNPLFIAIILSAVSAVVGLAVVFVYKQPNPSDLTASISSGEIGQVEPSQELVTETDSQPQSPTQPQIQEEPKVVSKPKVTKPAPITETVPNVQPVLDVTVTPSSVRAGESVTITVSPSGSEELSSVWLIDVFLESPTGLTTSRGSIVNFDGEGRRFGSIAIPQGAELGIWIIKTVQIFDNTGGITSYHYGADIFTTFTVAAPK